MKRNNSRTGMIKAKLKKVGVVPVRVTDPKTLNRVWQLDGENYGSLMEIHELPEVRKLIKAHEKESVQK